MTDTLQQIDARLEALRTKLKARDGKSAFVKNCEQLREEIARLEQAKGFHEKDHVPAPEAEPEA